MINPEENNVEKARNPEGLREIDRQIASVLLFSSDGLLLMGKKNPRKGGVFPDVWHIPGGGIEPDESKEQAAIREALEESGILLDESLLTPIPIAGKGESVKTLVDGERVWCNMIFNRFEIHLDQSAEELAESMKPGDDLVELRWFNQDELSKVQQIPGGREFFEEMGYIKTEQKF